MILFSLCFLTGIVLLQQFKELPSFYYVSEVMLIFIILIILFPKYYFLKLLLYVNLGFSFCLLYIYFHTTFNLKDEIEGKNCDVTGYIASIPIRDQRRTTFAFALKSINHESTHGLIHLSWQNALTDLRAGDEWHFIVRLKKIHSTSNKGGFDYEAFYFQSGVRATGYVIDRGYRHLTHIHYYYFIHRFRQYLRDLMTENLPPSHTMPWIRALAIGEREGIHSEDWEVLRKTGTNHLMAIAGLHIGFMSGLVLIVVTFCFRRIPYLPLIIPTPMASGLSALFMAIIYSALAGFSLPTQRASIMISIFLLTLLLRRNISSWYAWSVALFLVLLINPLSVLTDSFWLSFCSVALIIYGMSGRLSPNGWWWKHGRIQWVISIGLIPLSIWLFYECSLISFIANSIAIPIVGLIIVPVTLFGTLLLIISPKFVFLLQFSDSVLMWLWKLLILFSEINYSSWTITISKYWMFISACLGAVLLLMPNGLSGRWLGGVFILPIILQKPIELPQGQVLFTLLDVGQGLSAVIQTQHHVLLYDTGARLNEHYDMGASVILPYLQSEGIKKISMLVVSHGDNDHSGGAETILKKIPVVRIKTSTPELFPNKSSLCLQGEHWEWDHVLFEFIYPDEANLGMGNNSSCVLRVTAGNQHILLTGDIEKWAEQQLLNQTLSSDILVAPHHGSKTSGDDDFIDAVEPRIVLFPIGYRNRYHFPHPSVVKKYEERGIKMYDSVSGGTIQFILDGQKEIKSPCQYRLEHKRYWNHI